MSVTESGQRPLEELPPDVCARLLRRHRFGRVAVIDADGPMIFPVNYALDGSSILFRTGEGTKLNAATDRSPATFEIDGIDTHHRVGWSVVARGTVEEVTDSEELSRLEGTAIDSYRSGTLPRLLRLPSPALSGRRISVPPGVAEAWLDRPDVGNVWYDRDGSDLLG